MAGKEIGEYYVVPTILSFDGVDKQVNSKLSKVFGDVGKKGGADLAKGAGPGLRAMATDADAAAKAYARLKDKAADALGKVRADEAALAKLRDSGASDDRIIRAEERLAKSRRDSGRASREASDSHSVLLSAQKSLGGGSDELNSKFSRLSGGLGGAKTAMLGAGAVAGGAALAGIVALGAGVLVAGNRLYELGAQFDDLSDNLQIKTGLSGDALEELKSSVERLGTTNVPDTFENIGNVAAEVTRSLHLTGPEFDAVTSRLANLQRMGVDVDIRTLGKAFRGFGVDAKDQAPALNSLYEASTKSGLSIDNLIAAVAKGGPALRQLGLGFGESAALVASFEEAGLDGEKGMTALTKATAYFAKENIPAEQGLRDTIARIQQLGDTPEAADLANKVFGAKGGAAFYEAIRNGNLDLQSLQETLSQTGLDINQVSADTADWSEKWQDLKNELAVALEPLASGFFNAVNEELGGAADALVENKAAIVDFFEALGDLAITGAENFAHGIGGMLQALGDLLGGIGNVKGGLDSTMAFFADLRGDEAGAAAFRESAQEAFGWGESLRTAGDKLVGLNLDGARAGLRNVGDAAKTSGTDVQTLGNNIGALPPSKNITLTVDDTAANAKLSEFGQKLSNLARAASFPIGPTAPRPGTPLIGGGAARGGVLPGYSPGRDNLLVPMSGGEGVIVPPAVRALGGAPAIGAINRIFGQGYAKGGIVGGPDIEAALAMVGTPYSQGNRTDCSGMVARVINRALGLPDSGLMSTKNAESWLAERGFVAGKGGPGAITVGWYDKGPNPNDGHMAMTLSDGSPAEAGGSHGQFLVGSGAKGADDPSFDQHMYLPQLFAGEGAAGSSSPTQASSGSPSPFAGGSAISAMTGGGGGGAAASGGSSSSGGGGGGDNPLKELLGILGGGLKETLGVGDWLPDIADNPFVKGAEAFIGTAVGMANAAADGSWTPGGLLGQAMGLPDVAAPPMPQPGTHGGSGTAPGPAGPNINIDQSINGNVGWDPNEVNKQRDEGLKRAIPRIPTGV